jgi:hypothetical protein
MTGDIKDILGLVPTWLDMAKIGGIAVLTLAVVQYFKSGIPDAYIKYFTIASGIILAILGDLYAGSKVIWYQVVINGVLAGIMSDLGYAFLSKKGGTFALPSKSDLIPPPPPPS